jgi:hypothetical protein
MTKLLILLNKKFKICSQEVLKKENVLWTIMVEVLTAESFDVLCKALPSQRGKAFKV